jgi:ABC-type proline/glycine betaine transport system permease subunit
MAMESVMLTIKFALLLAMEVFVVATIVGALILGVYQIVKDKVRESRRLDEIAPETNPITPSTS